MLNHSVVQERREEIHRSLAVMEDLRAIPRDEFVREPKHYLLAERCLQLAIECITDICYYIAAKEGWGKPRHGTDAIALMGEKRALDAEFAGRIVSMGNFRNILVHAYLNIDRGIVHRRYQRNSS